MAHQRLSWRKAKNQACSLLEKVGLPACRIKAYPHTLSGGMRQRVLIAMALGLKPAVLIADEPTTNIDIQSRGEILDLLQGLKTEEGMAILHITHDLREVRDLADEVAVLYEGKIVETKPLASFMEKPQHPFSRHLLQSARYLDPNLFPPGCCK